ncbi:MAG: hypothetical protein WC794_00265 [Candidatus Doudnabacteria bacterium]
MSEHDGALTPTAQQIKSAQRGHNIPNIGDVVSTVRSNPPAPRPATWSIIVNTDEGHRIKFSVEGNGPVARTTMENLSKIRS